MFDFLKRIPTHMDYDGQKKAERIFQTLILLSAVIGLVLGCTQEKFSYTVYSLGVGFVLSAILTLPPWPMYRRKPLPWQPSVISSLEDQHTNSQAKETTSGGTGKGKAKKAASSK